jgi:hypothetical protein
MLAQVIDPAIGDIIRSLVGTWQPIAAAVAPIVLGLITSDTTRQRVKQGLPVLVAAALTIVSVLTEQGMTWSVLVTRVPALWLIIESAYRAFSLATAVATNTDRSLNTALFPSKGLVR